MQARAGTDASETGLREPGAGCDSGNQDSGHSTQQTAGNYPIQETGPARFRKPRFRKPRDSGNQSVQRNWLHAMQESAISPDSGNRRTVGGARAGEDDVHVNGAFRKLCDSRICSFRFSVSRIRGFRMFLTLRFPVRFFPVSESAADP